MQNRKQHQKKLWIELSHLQVNCCNFPFIPVTFHFPQQALPEENYTTEDHDVFTISGRTCIEEGNGAQVLSIVLDDKNQVGFFE